MHLSSVTSGLLANLRGKEVLLCTALRKRIYIELDDGSVHDNNRPHSITYLCLQLYLLAVLLF